MTRQGTMAYRRRYVNALERDPRHGTENSIHTRLAQEDPQRERPVRVVRDQPQERLQVDRAVHDRRPGLGDGSQPRSRCGAQQDARRSRAGADADEAQTPDLGSTQTAAPGRARAAGADPAATLHGVRHAQKERARHGQAQAPRDRPPRAAQQRGQRPQRQLERRLQGPVQDRRRHLLLPADCDRQLQPLHPGVPGAAGHAAGADEGGVHAAVQGAGCRAASRPTTACRSRHPRWGG